jgi:hypothetical protein
MISSTLWPRNSRPLQREANALFAEAAGRETAWTAWQGVEPSRDELRNGVNFHREEAKWTRNAMLVVAAAVVALLMWTALTFETKTRTAADIALFLSIRAGLVAVLAGLVVFMGKLHSRHSQQGVIYQEKLAGLDAVRMIVANANAETIRGVVQQMAKTYLRAEADAFRGAHHDADAGWREAVRLAKRAAGLQDAARGRQGGDGGARTK